MPGHFKADDETLSGTLHITAKSDQSVVKIVMVLEETYETGRDDNKKTQLFTLGTLRLNDAFDMKAGEVKTIPFSLPFQVTKSANDKLAEKGGMMGAIGKMGKWADDQKSTFKFKAEVDVKGASLDPSDHIELKMTK
jgi:hypothetical protein